MRRALTALGAGVAVTVGLAATMGVAAAPAGAADEHVRGDVVALKGNSLEVKSSGGEVRTLRLGGETFVAVAFRADPGSITQSDFVGAAAVPGDQGTLRALEVHVFPPSMRGTGEGHRPWDLRAGSTMTNATVSSSAAAPAMGRPSGSMTNATVASSARVGGGARLLLRYAGGQQTLLVPPGTPVVRLQPGDRSRLTPGAHVFAVASREADGSLFARRVYVGADGVRPPM